MQCSRSAAGAAAVRLAVLLDLLYFTPGADAVLSIEPACLVMVRASAAPRPLPRPPPPPGLLRAGPTAALAAHAARRAATEQEHGVGRPHALSGPARTGKRSSAPPPHTFQLEKSTQCLVPRGACSPRASQAPALP